MTNNSLSHSKPSLSIYGRKISGNTSVSENGDPQSLWSNEIEILAKNFNISSVFSSVSKKKYISQNISRDSATEFYLLGDPNDVSNGTLITRQLHE